MTRDASDAFICVLAKGFENLDAGAALGFAEGADGLKEHCDLHDVVAEGGVVIPDDAFKVHCRRGGDKGLQAFDENVVQGVEMLGLVDGDGSLTGEYAEQFHVLHAERGGADFVEHLHDANDAVIHDERHREYGFWYIAGAFRRIAGETRVALDVGDGDGLSGVGDIARNALIEGDVHADNRFTARTIRNAKDDFTRTFVNEGDGCGGSAKDARGGFDNGLQKFVV